MIIIIIVALGFNFNLRQTFVTSATVSAKGLPVLSLVSVTMSVADVPLKSCPAVLFSSVTGPSMCFCTVLSNH